MNIRAILFLGVAALGVLLVVMATRSYLSGVSQKPVEEKPTVQVLVAARDLPPGTILAAADVMWRDWPDTGVDPNYISKGSTKEAAAKKAIEKAKTEDEKAALRGRDKTDGKVVRLGLAAGQPVTRNSLVAPGEGGYIAAVLKPGMRAMTVKVNTYTGLGGFARPGDRVDVMLTHDIQRYAYENGTQVKRTHSVTETIMENVRVLGLNDASEAKQDPAVKKKKAPDYVTLELPRDMAERLKVLDEIGDLSFILRSLAAAGEPDGDMPREVSGSYAIDSEIGSFMPKVGGNGGNMITVHRGTEQMLMMPIVPEEGLPVKRTGRDGASVVSAAPVEAATEEEGAN